MTTRTRGPRAGFTLIELLVVMAIIATLVALLLPALGGARIKREQTANIDRMNKIATALSGLKDPQQGLSLAIVPAHPINTTVAPGATNAPVGFALKGRYNGNEPELFYLKKAWPNMNTVTTPDPQNGDTSNGYTGPDLVLDANQTIVFFLTGGPATGGTGFSTNNRRPFDAIPGSSRKGPFLEFNTAYIANGPTLNGQQAPWIIDPFGTPYAYFAAVNEKAGAFGGQSFTHPTAGTAYPVTRGGKFIKENSFQIISAGRDKLFGNTTAPASPLPLAAPAGRDDQGHFQETLLSAS